MEKKKKIVISSIAIIVIISVLFLFGEKALAIYRKAKSGTITTDLAEWNVTVTQESQSNQIDLVSGVTNQSFSLKVRNISEVDIDYTIVIGNLPSGVEVSLDNGAFKPVTNSSITFENAGTILYTDSPKEKTHTLEFKSNVGTAEITNQQISIDVIAKQVL